MILVSDERKVIVLNCKGAKKVLVASGIIYIGSNARQNEVT